MTDTPGDQSEDGSELDSVERTKRENEGLLAALRAEHKHIHAWNIDGFGLVVARRMRKFEELAVTKAGHPANKAFEIDGDASELTKVNETVVRTCCVHPKDPKKLTELFNEWPDFSAQAAVDIQKLGKAGITDLGKS